MIKILLVDDDFLVRTFLSRLTNWNAHGYSVVGAAQDGYGRHYFDSPAEKGEQSGENCGSQLS